VIVRFSELAEAGMRSCMSDDQVPTSRVHLAFYLRRSSAQISMKLDVFGDVELYLYWFGPFRVLYEIRANEIFIWSFRHRLGGNV
jgi:hypothetical protein